MYIDKNLWMYEIIFSLKRLLAIFLPPSIQILRWLQCKFAEKMGIKYALGPAIEGEHPVKYIWIFSFDDWDWCLKAGKLSGAVYGIMVWCEILRMEKCDNLMFHTSIYGSSVRSNFTVILIANEIIFNMNKFECSRFSI